LRNHDITCAIECLNNLSKFSYNSM